MDRRIGIILVSLSILFIASCNQTLLQRAYTTAYKKNTQYFAGSNIEFIDSTNFSIQEFTDVSGGNREGSGTYEVINDEITLTFRGDETDRIEEHSTIRFLVTVEPNDSLAVLTIAPVHSELLDSFTSYHVRILIEEVVVKNKRANLGGEMTHLIPKNWTKLSFSISINNYEEGKMEFRTGINQEYQIELHELNREFSKDGDKLLRIENGIFKHQLVDQEGKRYRIR